LPQFIRYSVIDCVKTHWKFCHHDSEDLKVIITDVV